MDNPDSVDTTNIDTDTDTDTGIETGTDNESFNWSEHTWNVMDSYFKNSEVLVKEQINSYENFINTWLPTLLMQNKISVSNDQREISMEFLKCAICKPARFVNRQGRRPLTPYDSRNNNYTYSARLFVDIAITDRKADESERCVESRVCIAGIPAMVKSSVCHLHGRTDGELTMLGECPYDLGGYFIINGSEKVIIAQERPVENSITCFPEPEASSKPYLARAEVKSTIDQRYFPIKIFTVKLSKDFTLYAFLPYGRRPIPLGVIFKSFGMIQDKDIVECLINFDDPTNEDFVNIISNTIEESRDVLTQIDAIRYVSNSININIDPTEFSSDDELKDNFRMKYAKDLLNRELLPHVGNDPTKKLRFVSLMVKTLLLAYRNPVRYTDRDSLLNKRLDLSGPLLSQIFRYWFQQLVRDIKHQFGRILANTSQENVSGVTRAQEVRRIIQKSNIEKKLVYGLSTGNWYTNRVQANLSAKKGIAQVLQRLSYLGTISHLRRLSSPLERSGSKHEPPRRLHGTQIPKICPNETPEGAQVGTVKNQALLTAVSIETSAEPALYCLEKLGMISINMCTAMQSHTMTKVMVNGDFVGLIESDIKTLEIINAMKYFKRTGTINKTTCVAWKNDLRQVVILTDGGRYTVPYYRIDEDNHFVMDAWLKAVKLNGDDTLSILDMDKLTNAMPDNLLGYLDMNELAFNANKSNTRFNYHRQAAIEYLDTDEDSTAMIADTPERLYNGQTAKLADDGNYYTHLSWTIKFDVDVSVDVLDLVLNAVKVEVKDMLEKLLDEVTVLDSKTRFTRIKLKDNVRDRDLLNSERVLIVNLNRFISGEFVRYTHCLIHPCQLNGVVATNIPFSDHNPSPRNCYQSSMGKQALGMFATNYDLRWDTMGNILTYPQRPVVATRTAKYVRMSELHHGFTSMHAIATYTGYNQEDSLIGNLDSAKRGCFNSLFYRTYTARLRRIASSSDGEESFEVPPAEGTIGRKVGSGGSNRYHAIVTNPKKGPELPALGTIVTGGDVIIPKTKRLQKEGEGILFSDNSISVRPSEGGVVDRIIPSEEYPHNEDEEGYQFIKVRLCELRSPEIGDKFASRHAQKGTMGIQYNSADMMKTQDGICPDTVMNPHAIPSRMTLGQLLEAKCAKLGILTGQFIDSTPFTEFHHEEVTRQLTELGYDYSCDELMYNGFTGDMMGVINITPTYYQRLKHMVADKMHARDLGPIQSLTKQPAEGRARGGGLRLGEMERDALIAHGLSMLLCEKLRDASDLFELYVSKEKNTVISANPKLGIYQYGNAEVYEDDIKKLHLPYAMELFRKELVQGMVDMEYTFT